MVETSSDFVKIVGECDIDNVDLTQGNFNQIAVPETLEIPEQKPDVEQILKVMLEGEIGSVKLVETPEGESASGMEKTGKGLVVEGNLHQKIVYVAETDDEDQPVHSAEFNIPFSTFIPINTCLIPGEEDQIDVEICIEDVYVEMLNQREIFKNVTIVVNAIVPNTDPTVNILWPEGPNEDGAEFTAGDQVSIVVDAFDCECLDKIEIYIDGTLETTENVFGETNVEFTYLWTAEAGDGQVIEARVFDCAGTEISDTVTVDIEASTTIASDREETNDIEF
ncbi:DUF3794 domain-containing protein [Halanaerobaculum tunisiense]